MELEARAADAEKRADAGKAMSKEDMAMVGFRSYLMYGDNAEARGMKELRAKQADNNLEGGYLLAPEQFVNNLIKDINDDVFIRGLATTYTVTNAVSLGAPSLDTRPEDATWTTEIAEVDEETAMRFGKRELSPHPVRKLIKMSRTLVRKVPSAEGLVQSEMARKFGETQEKAFLTGNGNLQPLGVFTASDNGITTSRDVADGNTTTAISADNLRNVFYSLKGGHRRNGTWMFHRDAIKQISKLKTGDGQYLWQPGFRVGDPDTILGRPVLESEFAPNTFTTGQYVGIFGDFSYYWIADSQAMQIQVLLERYAEKRQIGYIAEMETDGMPVLENAFSRVTLA